ncbi:PAQR family membrane homeostasis protein TrhA [Gryllotalpicola ginsengisoli]|uniref:PAQR family membrane homeostasis protein TrhA n=1 Tax=Gryllotalpicola ginsengisoli TaxID=444608 RepID=UPI0003B65279|nr:hemolysin III family protein [Gryllotalpicola ginsengisoli]
MTTAAQGPSPALIDVKPSWRGWIHAATTPVTVAAGIVLICLAHGAAAKTGAAIFMATSIVLFGNSALYHRFNWSPPVKLTLKRVDHANIFLLIAGTYTPAALTMLPLVWQGALVLSVVWAGALAGVFFRIFWITAPRWLYVPLYLVLGWVGVAVCAATGFNPFVTPAAIAAGILIGVGGLSYMLGAVVYGFKWPGRTATRFGFHEVFHALTAVSFSCHWAAMLVLALDPPFNAG